MFRLEHDCDDCGGTGFSRQGWTDKNGYPEDQYGPCRCTVVHHDDKSAS